MGTGLLIINSETTPDSLIQGGTGSDSANLNQPEILPDKYESGTPNLPGIAGLNAGIKFVLNKKTDRIYNSELSLARMLYKRLEKAAFAKYTTSFFVVNADTTALTVPVS